jgi:hypothetical protein
MRTAAGFHTKRLSSPRARLLDHQYSMPLTEPSGDLDLAIGDVVGNRVVDQVADQPFE